MIPSPPIIAASCVVIAAAGYVRGYGGFGFSMISVAGMSLLLPLNVIIPTVVLMEVAASSLLIGPVFQQVQWRVLSWLLLGMVITTPVGIAMLRVVPPSPMKMAVAAVIIVLSILMMRQFRLRRIPGRGAIMGVGAASGILNGAAAMGGPPTILFFFSSATGAAASRASLIAYFLATDVVAAGMLGIAGMMPAQSIALFFILLAPMGLGLVMGSRAFLQTPEAVFRNRALTLLILLSSATLVREIVRQLHP